MKRMYLGLSLIVITLTPLVTLSPVYATSSASSVLPAASPCECVTYVVNKLFGGPLSGNWPTAASMATDKYWASEEVLQKTGNIWLRTHVPKANDVIIIQPNATIYVYNIKSRAWDKLSGNIGYGRGHIGFVVSARYDNKKGGWYITMQSANWDNDGKYDNGSVWSINGSWVTIGGCSNVNHSWIFVPNGPLVTFYTPYTSCANEGQRCQFSGTRDVAYGANGQFNYKYEITNGIDCSNSVFGDPAYGVRKACYISHRY